MYKIGIKIAFIIIILEIYILIYYLTQDGNTSLHYASKEGHVDIVQCLLSEGADSTIKNNNGQTSLEVCQNEEITHLIATNNPKRSKAQTT